MSNSRNISLWKEKSNIDYIPLFFSLWLSLNAWLKNRFEKERDRDLINSLKIADTPIKSKFHELIQDGTGQSKTFQGYFVELIRALSNAYIPYPQHVQRELRSEGDFTEFYITFQTFILEWDGYQLANIIRGKRQKGIIRLDDETFVSDDIDQVFAAYIENLYQIRSRLFHGSLAPVPENERVIKALYLTLSMIMNKV